MIVTTSRLLSTGVDAQTCRLIVLDRPVGSMTEFKQIVAEIISVVMAERAEVQIIEVTEYYLGLPLLALCNLWLFS